MAENQKRGLQQEDQRGKNLNQPGKEQQQGTTRRTGQQEENPKGPSRSSK
jgi:hypothetical protein